MGHEHTHDHDHDHPHTHPHGGLEETTAILSYRLDHNRHHGKELEEIGEKLRQAGREEAAKEVQAAVEAFTQGNDKLASALEHLK